MANIKKMENPRDCLIKVDRKEYETFVANLPRTKSFSDAMREYIKSCNEEDEKKKNLNSPNYSAVRTQFDTQEVTNIPKKYNATLDIYLLSQHEINKRLDTIKDLATLREIRTKAGIIVDITKTSIANIIQEEKRIIR